MNKSFRKIQADKPRELAYKIFSSVVREDAYSNLLLSQELAKSELDRRDKSFVTELVYGAIRQIGRNDYIASRFSNRPWEEVDSGIVDVIRLGCYQLFDMRVPTHAAVDATVNLSRKILGESKASFVNALMRKIASQDLLEHLREVQGDDSKSLAIRFSHPEWIINSYRDSISDAAELKELLTANNTAVPPTLVAWPGMSSQEDLAAIGAHPTKYSKFGGSYSGVPGELELIKLRKAGVQDEGSQLLTVIFAEAAKEHEPWVDLCAGPGGKAALLSYLATSPIIANEISEKRADLIRKVCKSGTQIIVGDGREFPTVSIGAILADVPCTGLGAIRRRPEIRWRRLPSALPELTKLQSELAARSIAILPSGGIFGYATCSPHLAETKAQCLTFEKRFNIERIPIEPFLPEGLSQATSSGFMQLWPHRHNTDAMFLALYRKN